MVLANHLDPPLGHARPDFPTSSRGSRGGITGRPASGGSSGGRTAHGLFIGHLDDARVVVPVALDAHVAPHGCLVLACLLGLTALPPVIGFGRRRLEVLF